MSEAQEIYDQIAPNEIQALQLQEKDAKYLVNQRDAIFRLAKHPDFQLVFDKGLFEDKAASLVLQLQDPAIRHDAEVQKNIEETMRMISGIRCHLSQMVVLGNRAAFELDQLQEEIVKQRKEDLLAGE